MLFRPQVQITSQMPKFELKPVDGGNIVHLPEGETVFGRGPLFGVNDKRVSRHHGVLENVDGVLRIKPTHLNPCFIQSSLEAAPQPLRRDQWHTLGPGDLFSLLPGKYIYRVEALEETLEKETETEDVGTLRNSQNLDVENRRQSDGEEEVPEKAKSSCSARPSANEEPEQSTSSGRKGPWASQQSTLVVSLDNRRSVEFPPSSPTADLGLDGGGQTSPPQQRKRTLPAWMITAAAAGEVKTPSTPKGPGKRGPAKGAAATTTPKPKPKASSQATAIATATSTPIRATTKRDRTRVLSSEDEDEDAAAAEVPEEGEEEEEVVQVAKRIRKRRKSSEEDDKAEEAAALPAQAVKPSRRAAPALDEMSEESDSMEVEQAMDKKEIEEEEKEKDEVEVKRQTGRASGASSLSSGDAEGSGSSKRNGSKPSPQNGHRAQQVASEAKSTAVAAAAGGSGRKTTNRTPCLYGRSCYRKNPIHFQECSHPGDSDYAEESGEEVDKDDDDRQECPYGTDCYRTNILHKKEYKHTRPPARTSTRTSRRDRDDEEEDEDTYDDSFINDDSEEEIDEDIDEDSDYVPDDSGDSGKEDVKRLQIEAKAFLQRKK